MALDKYTFGEAPAAMYLVELLNQRNDKGLIRKVSKILATSRGALNDLARAHLDYDTISTRTLSIMLNMMSEYHHKHVIAQIGKYDMHIAHLVVNVLEGGIKTWKRRVQKARRAQPNLARNTPKGCPVDFVPAAPFEGEKTARELQFRSAKYLERKGKINTLYPDK